MRNPFNIDPKSLITASVPEKVLLSKAVIGQILQRHPTEQLAIAITGGKDSTLSLWLLRETCRENQLPIPRCLFIDEGDVFDEINEFILQLETSWSLRVERMINKDVAGKAHRLGGLITVSELSDMNRREVEAIGFAEDCFPFEPESYVGNHLMKTVPMKQFLEKYRIQALITAIRWDEQQARINENFFSARQNPDHTRVHPILHFRERDVWSAIHQYGIPFCPLYRQGYRSLGAKTTTHKFSDLPAWEQDLENTTERGGRAQGKEAVMEQLRALGYM